MFGVPPTPLEGELRAVTTRTYQASMLGAVLFGLGLVCLILAVGLSPQLVDAPVSLLVIALPLLVGSALGLALGYAHLHTRIELGAERLEIVAPSWRGVPVPPLQHLSVALDQVQAVGRRVERLGIPGLRLPVDVFTIETTRGRAVMAGYYLGDLEAALIEIVARAGCAQSDDGAVTVGLGHLFARRDGNFKIGHAVAFKRPRVRIDRPG